MTLKIKSIILLAVLTLTLLLLFIVSNILNSNNSVVLSGNDSKIVPLKLNFPNGLKMYVEVESISSNIALVSSLNSEGYVISQKISTNLLDYSK